LSRSIVTKPTVLLKEKAYLVIREAILNETFPPGEFLSEKLLIEHLGMSKTPIKSALDRLETEGFVTVSPKQGIIVRELSLTKARDIFELRTALELFVCELLSGKLKHEQIQELKQILVKQKAAADSGDEETFTKRDTEFHVYLCHCSGNAEIDQLMLNYQAHLYRFALRVIKRVPNRMFEAYQDHEQILNDLIDGDTNQSMHRMREHLNFGKTILTS